MEPGNFMAPDLNWHYTVLPSSPVDLSLMSTVSSCETKSQCIDGVSFFFFFKSNGVYEVLSL